MLWKLIIFSAQTTYILPQISDSFFSLVKKNLLWNWIELMWDVVFNIFDWWGSVFIPEETVLLFVVVVSSSAEMFDQDNVFRGISAEF